MYEVDTSKPVMVTGATGFVAGWLVKGLLESGATIHAPVRNPDNIDKLASLNKIAERTSGQIKFFKADLMTPGSYAEAMAGCGVVFHTASPFTSAVKDPQKELIEPAVEGTRNVLNTANATESVTRVVVTSSCAAIYTDAADCAAAPGGVLTEAVWNETASLEYQPYSYSKTLAEKAAWEIADAQSRWKLVTVNPCLVMGPAIGGVPTSESFNIMKQVGEGAFKRGAPRLGTGIVDVRDLAEAHMAAGFVPSAEGRHIIAGHNTDLFEVLSQLKDRFGARYPIPTSTLPKWLVWLAGPSVGMDRKFVSRNVNVRWEADNSKSKAALGMTYRSLKETMEDMFQQMIDAGAIKAA